MTTIPTNVMLGVVLFVGSMAVYSTLDATMKLLVQDANVIQLQFLRGLFGLLVLVPFLPWRQPWQLQSARPWVQVLRAMTGLAAACLFFLALRYVPLAEATAIGFLSPAVGALLAWPVLGEKPNRWQVMALVVGFCGVLVVLQPDAGAMHAWAWPWALVIVAGIGFYSSSVVISRFVGRHDSPMVTVVWTHALMLVVAGTIALWVWEPLTPWQWLVSAISGALGVAGQFLLVSAVRHAPIATLTPFEYTALLFAIGYGWLLFDELPGLGMFLGVPLIIAASFLAMRRPS